MIQEKDSVSSTILTPKILDRNETESNKEEQVLRSEPSDLKRIVLIHSNGDRRTCSVRCAIFKDDWKKARKILVIIWGDLAGEFALDIERNNLYNFGPGGGLRRHALQWSALDPKQAWKIWYELTGKGVKNGNP